MKHRDVGKTVELETPAQERLHRRLGSRLVLGGLSGTVVGMALGALVGAIMFDRPGAIWTSILGAGVFGFGVGMLILGYSSLESPDPGLEPSDTERPIADRPELVREEQEHAGDEITGDGSVAAAAVEEDHPQSTK